MTLENAKLLKYMRDNGDVEMMRSFAKRACNDCRGKGHYKLNEISTICSCVYKNVKKNKVT